MEVGDSALPHLTGHSTRDALGILHDELQSVILLHEISQRRRTYEEKWDQCFLNHEQCQSPFHWTNCVVLLTLVILLFLAYGSQEQRNPWLIVEALLVLFGLVFNLVAIFLDEKLKENEILYRAKSLLKTIKMCSEGPEWRSEHFVNLHAPQAPSVSLQWTYRDEHVVNLPCAFLVEGDVILLRPGQEVPAKCRTLEYFPQLLGEAEIEELQAGEIFNPNSYLKHTETFTLPEARKPSRPRPFMMLETPFSQNLKEMIRRSCKRPVSILNNERYMVYSIWVERRILPAVLVIMFVANLVRVLMLREKVGHWTEMFIIQQVEAVLPLTGLVLPLMWRSLDVYGVAKILIVFNRFKNCQPEDASVGEEFGSESNMHIPVKVEYSWRELVIEMWQVMSGITIQTLSRTSNPTHVLGSVTSFCCVDKKGILSWPNPTAEKVFFLRNDLSSHKKRHSVSEVDLDNHSDSIPPDSFADELNQDLSRSMLRSSHGIDYPYETNFEVLDLTPDAKNGYKLHFDDLTWKKYLTSLKPLGLNILLNTCNMSTVSKYTEFADHVCCASLKREEATPVLNKRCFCELARQIGFSDKALEIFRLHQVLGMYRHLPSQVSKRGLLHPNKSVIKYKMPMPNIFSVVVKEMNNGMAQLMSQGTGDMLLDACSDYWDGHDLCTFTEIDRKKVTDFYQRTSMSAYCTAFSYRPLTQALGSEFRDLYLEIPEVHNHLYPQTHSPIPTKSWDTESLDSRIQSDKSQYHYSMDSLLNIDSNLIHDIDGAFRIQCNQVFIGMITMQYQARQDVVKLIEDLESACIRFVHYSKENELRSRVFSEKMGLEAGWNCHISLLSEKPAIEEGVSHGNVNININSTPPSKMTLASSVKLCDESRTSMQKKPRRRMERVRRESAPGAINLEVTQVTFESVTLTENSGRLSPVRRNPGTSIKVKSGSDMNTATSSPTRLHNSSQMMRHNSTESDHVTFPLLKNSSGLASTPPTPAPASPEDLSRDQVSVNLDEVELQLLEAKQDPKESDENMSTSESYHASSHFTENTDSVSGAFGLANRAKLPKGIENIRPHIDNVDNVPLLVSLFTDCTPKTTGEMMQILQEYGEVVCCLGSSANIHNTGVFLQADCSLAMEPQYPHVCMRETAVGSSWDKKTPGPLELSNHLYSLPCTLFFRRTDRISIMQLIAQARQHVEMVRHTFLLLLLLQLSLAVLQVLAAMSLPPALCPHHVIWLAVFVLPAICITMNANPSDRDVMKRALGKNNNHLSSQVVLEFLFYFSLGCVPTILVCLVCHGLNLNHFCHMVADPLNVTCHLFYGSSALGNPGSWNGFATDLSAGLALSQNIVAFQFVLYAGCASMCFIHRHHHVWQRSPFTNHVWCVVIVVLLVLQVIYFSADMALQNSLSVHAFVASDIPMHTLVLALLWPVVLICIQELIKRRERRLSIRYQKRARLDFGTKLGMNSPF